MLRKLIWFLLVLSLISVPVFAGDLVGTYRYPDGQLITLSTRDTQNIRMDMNTDSYMLLKKNKIYAVSKDEEGQWNVLDMDQMKGMGSMTNLFGNKNNTTGYDVKFKETGRAETIAGYKGKVYLITFLQAGKIVETKEMVLSTHPEIIRINAAWTTISARMGKMAGANSTQYIEQSAKAAQTKKYGGVLRVGNDMILQSLSRMSLNNAHYELPANAEMTDIKQSLEHREKTATGNDKQIGQELSQDNAKDVEEATHQETQKATIEEVQEGIRSLFRGLKN